MTNSTYIRNFCIVEKDGQGKAWDMTNALQYVFINESLFQFHLLGFVTIIDSNNWLEKLPIDNSSVINFKFYSPNSDFQMELTFRISGVSDIQKLDGNKKQYNVQFVSEEAYQNFKVRLSRGYAGSSVAIVQNILSTISQKNMLVSKTEDDAKILAANMNPYKVIDLLNLYGSSSCYDFLLWENFRGLNYHRLSELLNRKVTQKLLEKDTSLITENEIYKNPDYLIDKNNIVNYFQSDRDSLISYLKEGSLGSTTYTYDCLTGMPYKYEVNQDYKDAILYHFQENSLNYKNYPSRHKILNEAINNEFLVTCDGDYNRCTGDMCYVEINGQAKQAEYMSSLSGNFLIMRIEHEFTPISYKQTIGLTR